MCIRDSLLSATSDDAIGKAFNLGAPDPLSLEETAKIMCNQIEGTAFEMVTFPQDRKAIDVGDFVCDYSAFSETFGWQPKVSFDQGISHSINFFREELKYYI